MATKQLKHSDIPNEKGKAKDFLVKNVRPTLFQGFMLEYRIERARGKSWTGSVGSALIDSVKSNGVLWAIRTAAAAAITMGPNKWYGNRSWDPGFDKGSERMVLDSGPVARWFTTKAAAVVAFSSMQPEKMTTVANALLAAEFGICAIRMIAEQVAWRKTKFSGEVAGTGTSPLFAFTLGEIPFKALEKYPKDPLKRFVIATRGIWGNLVRIVHSGLIIAFGNRLWNKVKPKPPQDPSQDRNEYGYPKMPK